MASDPFFFWALLRHCPFAAGQQSGRQEPHGELAAKIADGRKEEFESGEEEGEREKRRVYISRKIGEDAFATARQGKESHRF